jgi:hypothetical protein
MSGTSMLRTLPSGNIIGRRSPIPPLLAFSTRPTNELVDPSSRYRVTAASEAMLHRRGRR